METITNVSHRICLEIVTGTIIFSYFELFHAIFELILNLLFSYFNLVRKCADILSQLKATFTRNVHYDHY